MFDKVNEWKHNQDENHRDTWESAQKKFSNKLGEAEKELRVVIQEEPYEKDKLRNAVSKVDSELKNNKKIFDEVLKKVEAEEEAREDQKQKEEEEKKLKEEQEKKWKEEEAKKKKQQEQNDRKALAKIKQQQQQSEKKGAENKDVTDALKPKKEAEESNEAADDAEAGQGQEDDE